MMDRIPPSSSSRLCSGLLASATLLALFFAVPLHAADVFKADNTNHLNEVTSWDGGVAPTSADVAVWDSRVATAVPNNVQLGADAGWGGIRIADPAGAVSLGVANILTLGAAGIDTSAASQSLTFSNVLMIGAAQTWNLGSGLTVRGAFTNSSLNLVTKTGPGTLSLANANPAGRIQIDQGIVSSSVSAGSGGLTLALNGGTFTLNAALSHPVEVLAGGGTLTTSGSRTLSGAISGSGPLTVISPANFFTWSGNNTGYSGTITQSGAGAVRLSSVNAVSAGAAYVINGTMNANASGIFNLGSLSGAGTVNSGSGQNYSIGALGTDTTFSGVIGGSGMIFKVGAGTLTLDGANTYGGATTISNGVLQVGSGGTSGKLGAGNVTNESVLVFNRTDTLITPNLITGSGSITNVGSGKLALTGANTYAGPITIAAGTVAFGTASLATGDVIVGDFATAGAVVTSSAATLIQSNITFGSGCAYEFDLGTFGTPPGNVVTNTGTVTLNGNVTVNLLGTNFTSGTITLLRYAGRSGAGSFVLGTLPPNVSLVSFNDDTVNKQVTLTINVGVVVDTTLRWVGDAAGLWDIGNLGNQIWREVGTALTTNYYDGAAVLFNDAATGTTNIDVTMTVSPLTVTVSNTNKTYTLGGVGGIAGATGLTKSGPGTLIITNANSYSGQTAIQGGLVVVAGETGALGTGGVTNNGVLIFDRSAATNTLPNTAVVTGQITGSGSAAFLGMDSTNSIVQLEIGTADGNPYAGGTTLSNVFVRLNANPSSDATRSAAKATGLGSGQITFVGNSVLELEDYNVANASAQSGNFVAPLHVAAGQTGTLRTAGRATVSSPLTGSGTFNLVVSYVRDNIAGDFSAFTGQINVSEAPIGGDYLIASTLGLPSVKLNLLPGVHMGVQGASGPNPVANNAVIPIGELTGGVDTSIGGGGDTPRTVTFRVGGLNTSSTFAGNFGSGHGLIKEGTGTFTLSGTNTYTGSTTVSNGVLALIGEAALTNSSGIRLAAPGILDVSGRAGETLSVGGVAQTLSGNGTLRGGLVVGSLGTLTPGFGVGTLTVTNTVTLGGAAIMELDRTASPNSDRIVSPSIAAGGTLTVTNLGAALQAGDSFQLFSVPVTGVFAAVNLPATDASLTTYTWTNKLALDGTIAVLTAVPPLPPVNPNPTNIVATVSSGSLTLTWPESHTGWTLQVQTNSRSVGLNTNWFNVAGSSATNQVTLPVDPANGAVFYRLMLP